MSDERDNLEKAVGAAYRQGLERGQRSACPEDKEPSSAVYGVLAAVQDILKALAGPVETDAAFAEFFGLQRDDLGAANETSRALTSAEEKRARKAAKRLVLQQQASAPPAADE